MYRRMKTHVIDMRPRKLRNSGPGCDWWMEKQVKIKLTKFKLTETEPANKVVYLSHGHICHTF